MYTSQLRCYSRLGSAPVTPTLLSLDTFMVPAPHPTSFLLKKRAFFFLFFGDRISVEPPLNSKRSIYFQCAPVHPSVFHEIFNEIGGGMTEGLGLWGRLGQRVGTGLGWALFLTATFPIIPLCGGA